MVQEREGPRLTAPEGYSRYDVFALQPFALEIESTSPGRPPGLRSEACSRAENLESARAERDALGEGRLPGDLRAEPLGWGSRQVVLGQRIRRGIRDSLRGDDQAIRGTPRAPDGGRSRVRRFFRWASHRVDGHPLHRGRRGGRGRAPEPRALWF